MSDILFLYELKIYTGKSINSKLKHILLILTAFVKDFSATVGPYNGSHSGILVRPRSHHTGAYRARFKPVIRRRKRATAKRVRTLLVFTLQIFEQSNHLFLVSQYLQVGLDHESGGDGDLFEIVF